MSNKSPRHPWMCTLKKAGTQNELLMNDISGVSSKHKRKNSTMAEDEVKRKNISKSIKIKRRIINLLVD